jgi:endonuclease YncB( thermonuclease family)
MILQKNELMNFSKISTVFLLLLFLFSCGDGNKNEKIETTLPLSFEGKVTGIKDGDTYKVFYNGKEQTIRLAHIDCPEKKQPFGSKAKKFASDICFGNVVVVKSEGKTDRYKRIIEEIFLKDGRNVNKELVNNGLAWHFKKYSDNQEYAELEIKARSNQIGIWSELNPIAPWEWRKK